MCEKCAARHEELAKSGDMAWVLDKGEVLARITADGGVRVECQDQVRLHEAALRLAQQAKELSTQVDVLKQQSASVLILFGALCAQLRPEGLAESEKATGESGEVVFQQRQAPGKN